MSVNAGRKRIMTSKKRLHQQLSELDNEVFSAFCDSFQGISWKADYKDSTDEFCGIDLQLTGTTNRVEKTYDIELKSRFQQRLFNDCYFESDKWYRLIYWDNDIKLYVAIYPYCNKIAIWNVNSDLLTKSEKGFQTMNRSFCGERYKTEKQVYKFKFTDGKLYDFNITPWKEQYYAIYQQITQPKDKMEKTFQQ